MHKRPRLTDGFHRPSDDDNSSSGCSSAGPSGLRNLVPSPVSTNGPRSTSGSIFSRPSPVDEANKAGSSRMMTTSRYSPYAIRPLVVRAKRKLQSDNNVHVTSTAQRIINALENISTPVVNSVKIPFEPTFVSRPIFTPLRRDTQGPPILKSPLVPSPQGKIAYSPSLHIPKMVDFGTNTDLNMQCLNMEQQLSIGTNDNSVVKSDGGGKMKGITSRIHAPPVRANFSVAVPARTNHLDGKVVASKYKFSKPWSINDIRRGGVPPDSKSLDAVDNKQQASNERSLYFATVNEDKPKLSKEPEAGPVKPLSALVKPRSGWDCPMCMVPNKDDAGSCACCGEKNPKAPAASPAPAKPALKNWDCPTCMVPNKSDASACVCCGEKNPNAGPAAGATTPATKPAFQFGFAATTPKTGSDTFTFGPPKDASTPKSTFTFGVKSENTSTLATTAGSTPSSSFTFGVKATESSKSLADSTVSATPEPPKPSFGFGKATSSPAAKTAAPSITFGIPAEPSAATAAKSSPAFGIKAPEAAVGPKDTPSALKTSSPLKNNVFGSFSFGSAASTPPPPTKPSTNVIPEEMWSCENCPAKNRMSITQCIGCAVPKPKPEYKSPPGAKKFHFEPFFGGRDQAKPSAEAFSPPEGELKRKIPSNSSGSSAASLGFTYTPPSEPTLKMKAPEATPTSSAAGEMKSGSFLDALKNKSQFTFTAPSPGSSLIPTSPAGSSTTLTPGPSTVAAISTPAPGSLTNLATTTIATLPSAISSTTSTVPAVAPSVPAALTTNPPSGLFQFGAASSSSSSITPAPSSKAIATPNFGAPALNNNTLNQSTFSFGSGSGGGLKNGPLSSSSSISSATPSIFGNSTGGSSAPFVFGATPAPAAGGLGLGGPAGGTQAVSAQPSPGGFSFAPVGMGAPNFNFGSSAAAAAPAGGPAPGGAFVFAAQPSGSPQPAERRIRKAARRIR